ncbi:hypothetical protein [Anaerobutyricum hallii]|jgi:hypothetical protein|uniref:hypothetical protein n=1 Tax=Anaerobutyricum hallii TaxID=39488 RepID=UPI00352307D0
MSKLVSNIYKLSRQFGKTASMLNDIENLSKGNVDKVIKKRVRREIHKEINKKLK